MTRRSILAHEGERGASLILALSFIVFFAIVVTAVLDFAITSQNSSTVVQNRTKAAYAAKAALDTAITRIRNDPQMVVGKDVNPSNCGLTYSAPGVPDTTVTCTPTANSGAVRPGLDAPANALLTLGGDITATGPGRLATKGNVFANGAIALNAGAVLDAYDYGVTATNACTPAPAAGSTVWLSAVLPTCNATAAAPQFGDGADPYDIDPRYGSRIGELLNAADQLPKANQKPTCVGRIVTFNPGYYTDSSKLEKAWWNDKGVKKFCTGGQAGIPNVYYFRPGVYYFDFASKKNDANKYTWNVKWTVIGGNVAGSWYASSQAPGNLTPNTGPVHCSPGTDNGVQFVFGGLSRLRLDPPAGGAVTRMELCPKVDASGFGIPLLGLGPKDPRLGSTAAVTITTHAGVDKNPILTTPVGAGDASYLPQANWENLLSRDPDDLSLTNDPDVSPIDNRIASSTAIAAGKKATVKFDGFELVDPDTGEAQIEFDAGLTIADARVRLRHREDLAANVQEIKVKIESNVANCDAKTNLGAEQFLPSDTWITDEGTFACLVNKIDVTGDLFESMKITVEVKAKNTVTAPVTSYLDGLEILITYAPRIKELFGCTTTAACAFFSTAPSGTAPQLALWGTTYAPTGHFDVNFRGGTTMAFDRGAMIRSLTASGLPATDTAGRFRLGAGTGRGMELVATQNGKKVARAVVRIVDSATADPHGYAVAVREWSTAR